MNTRLNLGSYRLLAAVLALSGCGAAAHHGATDDSGPRDLSIVLVDDGGRWLGPCSADHPCSSEKRCYQGQCVPDNGTCTSDDDCENDSYCDCDGGGGGDAGPCLGGICLPWGTGPRGLYDPDCATPGFTAAQFVAPKLKCSWTGSGVMSSTFVADLDGDKVPEIIAETLNNTLIALHGKDCSVMFEKPFMFSQNEGHLAIADLDGDKVPEIITLSSGQFVTVLDNKGNVLATSSKANMPFPSNTAFAAPAIADIDNQFPPEIIAPGQVLRYTKGNPDLAVLWNKSPGNPADGLLPLAADFDGDRKPEVVMGSTIWDGVTGADKTPPNMKAALGGTGAFSAVGDFTGDKKPDLVIVQNFGGPVNVWVWDVANDTKRLGPIGFPGQRMGAPTVADFDGDGTPEFATAGADAYRVFSLKCRAVNGVKPKPCDPLAEDGVLWKKATKDMSSGVTGSSVFDFNGDGKAEVVYRDECWLRVYNGPDGKTLFATSVSSFTALEEPVIADVDNDGHAEIITSADYSSKTCDGMAEKDTGAPWGGYIQGIFVFQDPMKRWMPSRGIWNQHTYHITNVNDDLTIPQTEKNNWLTYNNYRQNVQGTGNRPLAIGDATAGVASDVDNGNQPDCSVAWTLRANLCNRGSADLAAGMPGTFYRSDPRAGNPPPICTAATKQSLSPGACETISCDWKNPPPGPSDLWFRVDDDGMNGMPIKECKPGNDIYFQPHAQCGKIG